MSFDQSSLEKHISVCRLFFLGAAYRNYLSVHHNKLRCRILCNILEVDKIAFVAAYKARFELLLRLVKLSRYGDAVPVNRMYLQIIALADDEKYTVAPYFSAAAAAGIFKIFAVLPLVRSGALALDIAEKQFGIDGLIDISAVINRHKRLGDKILVPGDKDDLDSRAQRADKLGDIHAALIPDGNIKKGEVKISVCILWRKLSDSSAELCTPMSSMSG